LKDDAAVVEVSRRMNALPIWGASERADTFRNPAGVALKLANFRAIERDVALQHGLPIAEDLPSGMGSYSRLDRIVFEEYFGRWADVRLESEAIWEAAGFARASIVKTSAVPTWSPGTHPSTAADSPSTSQSQAPEVLVHAARLPSSAPTASS
jgi:5-methylcytosine-specific restriction enzyme A